MPEKEGKGLAKRRTIRQPPSIPFLWEERPGIAKKDWKPVASLVATTVPPPSPIKLIASVPFNWEEKPGTPLNDISQPVVEPTTVSLTPMKFIASVPFNWEEKPGTPLPSFSRSSEEPMTTLHPSTMFMTLPLPPVYSPAYLNVFNNNNDHGDGSDKQAVFGTEHEESGFETDDSFSSAPSTVISSIISLQKAYQIDNNGDHLETPSSPASETDSTSSYATDASSLRGASFLECLFPLLPPNRSFLDNVKYPDRESRAQSDYDRENDDTIFIKRPPTLGELIMMSRRRSYQRKAAQIREKHISMELLKGRAPGCCIFGANIKFIEGLQLKKKLQPRLKFF